MQPRQQPCTLAASSRFQILRIVDGTEVCEVEAFANEECIELKRRVANHLSVCSGMIHLVTGKGFLVRNGFYVWRLLRTSVSASPHVLSLVLQRPPSSYNVDGRTVDPFNGGPLFVECLHDQGFCFKCMRDAGASASDIFALFARRGLEWEPPTSSAAQMRAAGFSMRDLLLARTPETIAWLTMWDAFIPPRVYWPRVTNFSLFDAQLKHGGYTAADFRAAGYAADDLSEMVFMERFHRTRDGQPFEMGLCTIYGWRCVTCEVANEAFAFFTSTELKCAGYSAVDLYKARFSVDSLRHAGFSFTDIGAAGYTLDELTRWDHPDPADEVSVLSRVTDEEGTDLRRSRSRSRSRRSHQARRST